MSPEARARGVRVGRRYVPSEGGGAYFLGAYGDLWHAPRNGHGFDWSRATWTRGLMEGQESDPGWDFARYAEKLLRGCLEALPTASGAFLRGARWACAAGACGRCGGPGAAGAPGLCRDCFEGGE